EQHLAITFEAECATQHPEAAFMMPIHPLVKQASLGLEKEDNVVTVLKVQTDEVPAGGYDFAIYRWQFYGIKEDMILKPIALSEALTPHLSQLLERAVDSDSLGNNQPPMRDELETLHQQLWAEEREQHRQRTGALTAYRRESLTKSHRARIALLRKQLRQATSENIRRMRQSQIDSAEADYKRRCGELDNAMAKAEIAAQAVAYGVLEVEGR
ncbi:MAG: helicase, partial [Candidatus Poribacteria bacterium]|nr:helicase [Candidatus Poribacteria bacterium]